jgi:hypothetical protein
MRIVSTATDLSPDTGPASGGTPVTITGTGLMGATGGNFGGVPCPNVCVVNDTTVILVTPPGAGTVNVGITVTYSIGDTKDVALLKQYGFIP